jgi:hypothetical protein
MIGWKHPGGNRKDETEGGGGKVLDDDDCNEGKEGDLGALGPSDDEDVERIALRWDGVSDRPRSAATFLLAWDRFNAVLRSIVS